MRKVWAVTGTVHIVYCWRAPAVLHRAENIWWCQCRNLGEESRTTVYPRLIERYAVTRSLQTWRSISRLEKLLEGERWWQLISTAICGASVQTIISLTAARSLYVMVQGAELKRSIVIFRGWLSRRLDLVVSKAESKPRDKYQILISATTFVHDASRLPSISVVWTSS